MSIKLPEKYDFSHKDKQLATNTFLLMLVQGKDENGEDTYAYLGIKATVLEEVCQKLNRGKANLSSFGKVFRQGKGAEPSEEDKQYMEDTYFFNHDKINVGILN